jgi:hypothetical protein
MAVELREGGLGSAARSEAALAALMEVRREEARAVAVAGVAVAVAARRHGTNSRLRRFRTRPCGILRR